MKKQTDAKREAPISYRPPVDLRDEFRVRVERSGLSQNAFITHSVFGGEPPRISRRPGVERKLIAHLLSQTARLHDDLHDIGLVAGDNGDIVLLLEQALAELTAIRSSCFTAMERKP